MYPSLIGIIASSGVGAAGGDYESIATVTLGSAASTISFSSIPSTYQHLQLRGIVRSAGSDASYQHIAIQLNSDTGNNYWSHGLYGTGSSALAHADGSAVNKMLSANIPTTTQTASAFNGTVIDILDYANTNKNTTVRALGGFDSNGGGALGLYSGLWSNTAAVSTVTLSVYQGSNFAANSSFALYGIKG